jgi:hypothetical protein
VCGLSAVRQRRTKRTAKNWGFREGRASINQAATSYTLTASSTGLTGATSNAFAITPAAADHLLFSQQPTDTPAGGTINPVMVQVVDQFGNVVTNYGGSVTLSIGTDPSGGAATLSSASGMLTMNFSGGVATFSDLSIDLAGTGYTLDATSGSLTAADSTAFNVL